jgi:acetyl esterase/lipase
MTSLPVHAENSSDPLRFKPGSSGTAGQVKVYGQTINYTAYTVTYVAKPNDPDKQVMTLYIPSNATKNSPIFMPLNTGGYMELNLLAPVEVTPDNVNTSGSSTGSAIAAALALSKGIVVASPAGRGRNTTIDINGVTTEVGNGPAALLDLKAAVRYLKYNDAVMLGNANRIVVSGTSGGGAMTSLLGATGDSPAFKHDLDELGAAPTSDSVFAVSPFCPITDLDNANAAYEYFFYGSGITTANPGRSEPITLSTNDQRLSAVMAGMYPSYLNNLGLKHPVTGVPLKLNSYSPDAVAGGSYRNYMYSLFGESATRFILDSGYVASDGSLNAAGQAYMATAATVNGLKSGLTPSDFLAWNAQTRTATLKNWKNLLRYMNRMKPVGSFDNGFYNVTGEMDLFNTDPTALNNEISVPEGWNHFDPNLKDAIAKAGLSGTQGYTSVKHFTVRGTVYRWAAMLNPMYYLLNYDGRKALDVNPYAARLYGTSNVAKHWRIRVGSYDRDSSPFVSLNLATALQNRGVDVDYKIAWNQPHSGNYDNTDMINWIMNLAK